jgi:catalase (peroxidase I)
MLNFRLRAVVLLAVALSQSGHAQDYHHGSKHVPTTKPTVTNQFWWPELLDLGPLRQHSEKSNPMDEKYNYSSEFKKLDIKAVKSDLEKLMKK